jgi:hypothetical protein
MLERLETHATGKALVSCCGKRIAEVTDRTAGPWLDGIASRSALSANNGSEIGVA